MEKRTGKGKYPKELGHVVVSEEVVDVCSFGAGEKEVSDHHDLQVISVLLSQL